MTLLKRMESELKTAWLKMQNAKGRAQRELARKEYQTKLDVYLRRKQFM